MATTSGLFSSVFSIRMMYNAAFYVEIPNRQNGIEFFPAELLGRLCYFLRSYQVCRLVMIGCKVLNHKLCCPQGLVRLWQEGPFPTNSSFWRLFPYLKEIVIEAKMKKVVASNLVFPTSLQALYLDFDDAERFWRDYCHSTSSIDLALPNLHTLRLCGNSYLQNEDLERCIPTRLHTLSLKSATALSHFFALLPRSLTRFASPPCRDEDVSALPPTLEFLKLKMWRNVAPTLPTLRFGTLPLTRLDLNLSNDVAGFSVEEAQQLPVSITWLDINGNIEDGVFKYLPPNLYHFGLHSTSDVGSDITSQLPRELKRFTCGGKMVEEKAFAELPRGLTYLRVGWASHFTQSSAQSLPPTLKELHGHHSPSGEPFIEFLPRTLQTVSFSACPLNESSFRHAPPRLSKLRIINSKAPCPLWWLTLLPPTIHVCKIPSIVVTDECIRYLTIHYPQCFENHPIFDLGALPTLHKTFPAALRHVTSRSSTTFSLSNKSLQYLPRTMTGLRVDGLTCWDDETLETLPPNLTFLSFGSATQFENDSLLKLPKSITHLELPQCHKFTDALAEILPHTGVVRFKLGTVILTGKTMAFLDSSTAPDFTLNCDTLGASMLKSIENVEVEFASAAKWKETLTDESLLHIPECISTIDIDGQSLTEDVMKCVPPHITDIRFNKLEAISETSMKHLPPKLTRLDLLWCTTPYDCYIEALPTTLVHLDLRYAADLTDECMALVPRNVTYLNLSSALLTDDSAPHFPKNLKVLLMDNSEYTEACSSKLPKSITELSLGPRFQASDAKMLPPGLRKVQWKWSQCNIEDCMAHLPDLQIPANYQISLGIPVPTRSSS